MTTTTELPQGVKPSGETRPDSCPFCDGPTGTYWRRAPAIELFGGGGHSGDVWICVEQALT